MTYPLLILLFVAPLFFFPGCSGNNPSDDPSEPAMVYGAVIDINNNPVANADIHYFFGAAQIRSSLRKSAEPNPSTAIGFSIPERSKVVIDLLQFGTKKFLRNLIDTTYDAGNYSLRVDLSMLTNGFYIYRITLNNTMTERIMVHIIYDYSVLKKTEPLTRTDAAGKFTLPMSVLGIGQWMYVTNELNSAIIDSSVVDSIAIVVLKDTKFLIEGFTVNAAQSITRTFVLK